MNQKLLTLTLSLITTNSFAELALITTPVADLLSSPASGLSKSCKPYEYYKNIPLSPINHRFSQACPRLNQALFNEIVDIVETTTNEAKVKILNAYYLNPSTKNKTGSFWMLKSSLVPISKIPNYKKYIPKPIDYSKSIPYPSTTLHSAQDERQKINYDPNTITLTKPFYCKETKQTFSAGTRFKVNKLQTSKRYFDTYCINPITKTFVTIKVPTRFAIQETKQNTNEKRKLFISLITDWAIPTKHKSIPYVWGGCSFVDKQPVHKAKIVNKKNKDQNLGYYKVSSKSATKYGLDCSGLVLRAAQAAGIPYYYKNTTTLLHELQKVKQSDQLEPGDLIWLSGHVIIIANPQKNLCIEARDYGHGYGKVQAIHINELFKETPNMAKLKAAYLKGKPLTRINKYKKECGKYKVQLLKLFS